jgi:hypothetical protein
MFWHPQTFTRYGRPSYCRILVFFDFVRLLFIVYLAETKRLYQCLLILEDTV